VSKDLGSGDLFVIEKLKTVEKPVFLILNKIDEIKNEEILKKIDEYKDLYDFAEIIPLSALKNDNVDRLVKVIEKYLQDNIKYFSESDKTSAPIDFRICEIVREKIMDLTEDEVPHSVTCVMNSYEEKDNCINIGVDIIVDRDSLKK